MNPPYNRKTGKWIKKALDESRKGATVVCLIPARPDANYWHDYIFPYADQIWFVRGRITFRNAPQRAPFPSAIVVFNGKDGKYADLSMRLAERI